MRVRSRSAVHVRSNRSTWVARFGSTAPVKSARTEPVPDLLGRLGGPYPDRGQRRGDVLQIDAAKSRCNRFDRADNFVHVFERAVLRATKPPNDTPKMILK